MADIVGVLAQGPGVAKGQTSAKFKLKTRGEESNVTVKSGEGKVRYLGRK